MKAITTDNEDEGVLSFETVYRQHYATVYFFAKRFVSDTQTAEDITTDVFLKLWERFSNFTTLGGIKSFLFTSTKNACINHHRSSERADSRHREFARLLAADEESLSDELVRGRVYQYIHDEIEKLPAQEKRAFKMAYLEGKSNEEIAAAMGINNQSVRNSKTRALKALRVALFRKNIWAYLALLIWIKRLHQ